MPVTITQPEHIVFDIPSERNISEFNDMLLDHICSVQNRVQKRTGVFLALFCMLMPFPLRIEGWLRENQMRAWFICQQSICPHNWSIYYKVSLKFQSASDAIAFKLRWL